VGKHIVKVCCGGGQARLTIPKLVIRGLKWERVSYVLLEENKDGTLTIRRFAGGESGEGYSKGTGAGSDR